MRSSLILFFAIVILICGCTKSNTPPTPPVLDGNSSIAIISPADSSFFPLSATITIKAKLTASGGDKNLLDAYVIDDAAGPGTEIVKTSITKAGDILATLPQLDARSHRMRLIVRNPEMPDQWVGSELFTLFIGRAPEVKITLVEKDDISNTVHWTKSEISNFKAYEVYAIRTDAIPDRGPVPDGDLVGTITDRDVLSFRHNSVIFYYRYSYMVKVVTDEDERNVSERAVIESGNFIRLSDVGGGGGYDSRLIRFDPAQQRLYSWLMNKFAVIDPMTLTVLDSFDLPANTQWSNFNSAGTRIDHVLLNDYNKYQLASTDPATGVTTLMEEYTDGPHIPEAIIEKTLLYADFVLPTPYTPVTMSYNVLTGEKKLIRVGNFNGAQVISGNRVLLRSYDDSIFVYQYNAGDFTLLKKFTTQGTYEYHRLAYESNTVISIGNKLFDQSFNEIHSIDFIGGDYPNYFIGVSTDGAYAVTAHNEIINVATKQIERVYGDGFYGSVFFSNDNDVLFHFTGNTFNVRWQPGGRLHRYPWR